MSEKKNIKDGEPGSEKKKDIKDGEPVLTPEQEAEAQAKAEEEKKKTDAEAVKKAELDKVPEWVKELILKEGAENFDKRYDSKRDKEVFEEKISSLVKKNSFDKESEEAIRTEVKKLATMKDEEGNSLGYEKALNYVTKGLDAESTKKDLHIALGALPEKGEHTKEVFKQLSLKQFTAMPRDVKKKYMDDSVRLHGEVKYL